MYEYVDYIHDIWKNSNIVLLHFIVFLKAVIYIFHVFYNFEIFIEY